MQTDILIGLAGVLAAAAPVLFAVIGETITERAGIINLSLNGSILLSAMGGFAVAYVTGSLLLGFLAGMVIGAVVAFIVAFGSITLHQSQVAIGFVLALAGRDLAYFLGVPYMNTPGPTLSTWSIPVLKDIPIIGPLFFQIGRCHLSKLRFYHPGLAVDLPHPAWTYVARYWRASGCGFCARRECESVALYLYYHWRSDWRTGGTGLHVECQSRMDGNANGSGWHRLDRAFDYHFWRMESFACGVWSLPVFAIGMAGSGAPAQFTGHPFSGSAGCAFSIDDPDSAIGQYQ